ncbi:hypothetical protein L1887_38949 [Cichorium endivia]|nr:hypothetical protein L1887_38949 [Cichorium endivia]
MVAVVPSSLMERYETRYMTGHLCSITHFKLCRYPDNYVKYEGYSIGVDEYVIVVNKATRFTFLEPSTENQVPLFPLVASIETLVRNPYVVGKVISGRLSFNCMCELLLQDRSGFVVNLNLYDGLGALPVKIALAIRNQWVIYVSRVKYLEREGNSGNENGDLTQVSLDIEKEARKEVNRKYYERSKEKKRMLAKDRLQGYHEALSTVDAGGCSEVHDNPMIRDVIIPEDPHVSIFDGIPEVHRVLGRSTTCVHCGAKKFKFEFASFCCMSGKTKLASSYIPPELYRLFTLPDELGKTFRKNIRAYNTNFSFTSMGVTLDKALSNMKSGVYKFRANGGIYHNIDQLVSRDGIPRYLQLYFYDSETDFTHRIRFENIDKELIQKLTNVLAPNPYVKTFRSLRELGPLDNYRVTLNASVELDQRVYNRPTTSEVAGIWVEGNDSITTYKRSIVVYGRSDYGTKIQPYEGCYDPLSYPLLFPNGEPGWHAKIARDGVSINEVVVDEENTGGDAEGTNPKKGRNTVSMREYYCYKFQIRSTDNLILLGGRLLQQFVVDIYIKIETSRLLFCRLNKKKIRSDLYQGIVDCVNAGETEPGRVGQRVVLPASFIGGPRDMRRRFLDAMTLVQDDGKPDIFLTLTCNPSWPEIENDLKSGQSAQDRPDLVSRVFRAKLEDLKEQLLKKHILGVVRAYVYVIEFQKRGLPHAHFLLILELKLTNPDHYDNMVCAELPDPKKFPKMHEIVKKHMMHGPCGHLKPTNSCMQGDPAQCRWRYPKQFNEVTIQGKDSYPLYRRRNNGIEVDVRGNILDNRWVVPYNPKLLMMFNCHMNVEICSSIKSVKYAFKYVYKGHDKQVVHIDPDGAEPIVNEIKRFQDARYVSAPEAIWRIFSFALSQIHPFVMSLHLHLPNQHMVRFSDNDTMSDIVEREKHKSSMLTAFFDMNKEHEEARQYLYK